MASITAQDIVRLFEADRKALKRLAELLVTEEDIRMAMLNALLREAATKRDIERLEEKIEKLREYVDQQFTELRREIREEVRRLESRIWWVMGTVVVGWITTIAVILVERVLGG